MWKLRHVFSLFVLILLFSSAASVASLGSRNRRRGRKWQTLSGNEPLVIARGGFSGLFPDSSYYAYQQAVQLSLPNVHVWCDVQLTRDGAGICFPDINLENSSNIDIVFRNRSNSYIVNGVQTRGWFSIDFTLDELEPVNIKQRIYSRAPNFDGSNLAILTVDDLISQTKPPGLWLNILHDAFFSQQNLSMRSFVLSISRRVTVNYISSPEAGFLRSIRSQFRTRLTKLVFQFLGQNDVDPSTNQTYGSLLNNLTLIRSFASGILVPKSYILPVDASQYLLSYTSLVQDAHAAGLEVYAYTFANDAVLPYNYSYDPVAEYLSFIDNHQFSIDGVLSDFPVTPSAAIDCFSHATANETVQANVLIISNEGASGDFPGSTDRAYMKAVMDGADILDCPVQITSDGIPFCLGSINLRDRTNVIEANFGNLVADNPDLNIHDGIFAYSLNWSQIQSLRPAIFNPYMDFSLSRNPRAANAGNLLQLSDFLALANNASSISGVSIGLEHAAYLAQNQGLDVIDSVLASLNSSALNNLKRIMIRSSDSAVLSRFKSRGKYELVYVVDEVVHDILNSTILEIKKFASSVVVSKKSVFPSDMAFITGETNVVPKLQAFNLSVYVQSFRNEFVSQPWDFFSDAYVEINQYVYYMGVNGIISEFPATAARYRRNQCLGYKKIPLYMTPVPPGGLIKLITPQLLPPAEAPNPDLTVSDVAEPPLPPVVARPSPSSGNANGTAAPVPTQRNGQPALFASMIFSGIVVILAAIVLC